MRAGSLFGYFLTITQATQQVVEFMAHLPLGACGVLAFIMEALGNHALYRTIDTDG